MSFKEEQLKRLQESVEEAAARRKRVNGRRKDKEKKIEKKQPKELTDKEFKKLDNLQKQMVSAIQKNTNIEASRNKDENTKTKKEFRKGKNNNQGAEGIHSVGYRNDCIKVANEFIKYCFIHHGIKELREIKPRMTEAFCREKMEGGKWSSKTLSTRVGQLKKIGECSSKNGIKSHTRLVTNNISELKKEYPYSKKNRIRGKKADGSGMTLREARVIAKHAEEIHGPMAKAMCMVLTDVGPRLDELRKLKWEHIDFDNPKVSLTEKNMTKGSRPRICADISPKTMMYLKELKDTGLFPNERQTIFRSHFGSEKKMREVVKDACSSGKVAYLGIHAFRNATKELHTNQFKKELDKLKKEHGNKEGKDLFKLKMAEKFMKYVGAAEGLNPADEKGNKRYTNERVLNWRTDRLINSVVTQMFGHNRTDVLSEY